MSSIEHGLLIDATNPGLQQVVLLINTTAVLSPGLGSLITMTRCRDEAQDEG